MPFMKREDLSGYVVIAKRNDGTEEKMEFGYSLERTPSYDRGVLSQGIEYLGKSTVISVPDKLALTAGDTLILEDGNRYRFVSMSPKYDKKDKRRIRFAHSPVPSRWILTLE